MSKMEFITHDEFDRRWDALMAEVRGLKEAFETLRKVIETTPKTSDNHPIHPYITWGQSGTGSVQTTTGADGFTGFFPQNGPVSQ